MERKPNLIKEPVEMWVATFFFGVLFGIPFGIWVVASLVEYFCY